MKKMFHIGWVVAVLLIFLVSISFAEDEGKGDAPRLAPPKGVAITAINGAPVQKEECQVIMYGEESDVWASRQTIEKSIELLKEANPGKPEGSFRILCRYE